jgi:hypothetical protein
MLQDKAPTTTHKWLTGRCCDQALYRFLKADGSFSQDVAIALIWVIGQCTRNGKDVAGYQAANRNDNLIIGGVNANWVNYK